MRTSVRPRLRPALLVSAFAFLLAALGAALWDPQVAAAGPSGTGAASRSTPAPTGILPGGGPGTDPGILWGYLQNGIGYAVIPNHAAPMIGSVALVHGGSGAEDWSTQGASHFLEHLLFNGTESRTQEQIYDQIDLLGAYNNATTRSTHVAYLLATPRAGFWGAFDVQQDMLFHSTLPPEKVEKERGIILEELRKGQDDQSYELERVLDLDLFGTQGYGMPTVGSETSIRTLTRDQILGFYKGFYSPSRVTWILLGDLDPQAAVESLKVRVGGIPAGIPKALPQPAFDRSGPLLREHELSMEGAVLQYAWVLGDPSAQDFNLLRARLEVLAEGDDSPLARRCLARWKGVVDSYSGGIAEYPGFSVATVRLELSAPERAREVLDGFPALLAEARAEAPDPERVEAWRTQAETGEQYLREKPHYYGIIRGDLIAARGLAGLAGYLPGIQAVTPAAVAAVPPPLAWPPERISVVRPVRNAAADSASSRGQFFSEWDLPNGAHVAALSSAESPVLAVHLFIRDRSKREPAGRTGIAEMTQNLIGHVTRKHSGADLGLAFSRIGADLKTADDPNIPYDDFYTTPAYGFVRMQTLDRYAGEGMALLREILAEPVFTEQDFEMAKSAALKRVARAEGSSRATASRRLDTWLRPGGPGGDVYGTSQTLGPVTLEEVRKFAASYLDPRSFLFVVASSLPMEELKAMTVSQLGSIPVPDGPAPVEPLPVKGAGAELASGVAPLDAGETEQRIAALQAEPGQETLWARFFRPAAADAGAPGMPPGMSGGMPVMPRGMAMPGAVPKPGAARPAALPPSPNAAPLDHQGLALLADSVGSPQSSIALVRVFQAPDSLRPALTLANGILSDRLAFELRERKGLAYSIGSSLSREGVGTWVWTASAGTGPGNLREMLQGFREGPGQVLASPPESLEVAKTAARIYGRGIMRRATRINWAYYAGLAILDGEDPLRTEERQAALRKVSRTEVLEVVRRYWGQGPGLVVVAR